VRGGMKVRTYRVLCRAVEEGVTYSWRRAHKHLDAPDAETVEEQIVTTVLNEVCQYFVALRLCATSNRRPRFHRIRFESSTAGRLGHIELTSPPQGLSGCMPTGS
jgi:hypothetical protein